MRKICWFFGFSICFSSCGTSEEKTKEVKPVKTDSVVANALLRDTITCSIEPIDEAFYCKQTKGMGFCVEKGKARISPSDGSIDLSKQEQKLIDANPRLITKRGNDLIILSKKGELKFTNNPDHSSDAFIEYHLVEVNEKFITLVIYYYESFEYMVVNNETGKSFKTWGFPVFNKDKTMAIAGNFDLMAGFTNNGLQLFAQDSTGWNLKMQWILDDWGPENLAWLNDTVVLSKKNIPDEKDTVDQVRVEFVKINLRRERLN